MARDTNSEQRIETILYHTFSGGETGAAAKQIHDEEVAPLVESLRLLLLTQSGAPINAIEAGKWIKEARERLERYDSITVKWEHGSPIKLTDLFDG